MTTHLLKTRTRTLHVTAIAAAVLAFAAPADAQVFKQFAQTQTAPAYADQKPAPVPDRLLLNALVGLRLVDNADAIDRRGTKWSGVTVEGRLPALDDPEIRNQLSAMFVGKPLRTGDLARISAVIRDWYRKHSLPVVSVVFPEQPLTSGVLQGVVTVYKLGHVRVVGNQWFATSLLKAEMQLSPGQPIDFETLKDDLNRLNRNPFHRVEAVLARSQTPGDTDVELKVEDRFPLRVFASYDNEGAISTGRDRYSLGFTTGNVLALDQQISYQFTTSPDLFSAHHRATGQNGNPQFLAHSASWLTPMPWGGFLNAFGSYAQLTPDLGNSFGQVGHSLQLSGRYSRDLWPIGSLSEQI